MQEQTDIDANFFEVNSGGRTHDLRNHNPTL